MEEDIIPEIPDYKLYKDRAIYIATFLGGPMVAGYLIAENFKQLGELQKAKRTWLIAIVATVVIFGSILLIPALEQLPNYIFPLTYTAIAYLLLLRFQFPQIEAHIAIGGQLYSGWRVFWIALIGGIVTIVAVLVAALIIYRETLQ